LLLQLSELLVFTGSDEPEVAVMVYFPEISTMTECSMFNIS